MKLIVFALAALVVAIEGAPRQKRFAGLSTIGGSAGCVVTGNVLYANGYRLRTLTSAEQQELQQYQQDVADYKQQLREALEERRQQIQQRIENRRNGGGRSRSNSVTSASADQSQNVTVPKPPAKPSFCSAADTTQYYFDGCMIQNNKVYVGGQFARNLTNSEIQQLQEFDTEMTAYQQQLQSSIQQVRNALYRDTYRYFQKQVNSIFGSQSSFFSQLFGGPQQDADNSSPTSPVPSSSTAVSADDLQAPTPPNFCTAIF